MLKIFLKKNKHRLYLRIKYIFVIICFFLIKVLFVLKYKYKVI